MFKKTLTLEKRRELEWEVYDLLDNEEGKEYKMLLKKISSMYGKESMEDIDQMARCMKSEYGRAEGEAASCQGYYD